MKQAANATAAPAAAASTAATAASSSGELDPERVAVLRKNDETRIKQAKQSGNHWWKVLGCAPNSSLEAVKDCYKPLAKLHHPDKSGGNDETFKLIHEAYETGKKAAERAAAKGVGKGGKAGKAAAKAAAVGAYYEMKAAADKASLGRLVKNLAQKNKGGGSSSAKAPAGAAPASAASSADKAASADFSKESPGEQPKTVPASAGFSSVPSHLLKPKKPQGGPTPRKAEGVDPDLPQPGFKVPVFGPPPGPPPGPSDAKQSEPASQAQSGSKLGAQQAAGPPRGLLGAVRRNAAIPPGGLKVGAQQLTATPRVSAETQKRPITLYEADDAPVKRPAFIPPGGLRVGAQQPAGPPKVSSEKRSTTRPKPGSLGPKPPPAALKRAASQPASSSGAKRFASATEASAAGSPASPGIPAVPKLERADPLSAQAVVKGRREDTLRQAKDDLLDLLKGVEGPWNEGVGIPDDGVFASVMDYKLAWSRVVASEYVYQAFSAAEKAGPAGAFHKSYGKGHQPIANPWLSLVDGGAFDDVRYLRVEGLVGHWTADGPGWSYPARAKILAKGDALQLFVDDKSSGFLGAPTAHGWRQGYVYGVAYGFRLSMMNEIELQDCPGMRLTRTVPLNKGSVVAMRKTALNKYGASAPPGSGSASWRPGVLEQDALFGVGSLRICVHASEPVYDEFKVLPEANPIGAARELEAVEGVKSFNFRLRDQLLYPLGDKRLATDLDPDEFVMENGQKLPCVATLNDSQLRAVQTACNARTGFNLVWGPPGTGKSTAIVALINTLHVQEYAKWHKAVERYVVAGHHGEAANEAWRATFKYYPRILVTAASNTAVNSVMARVMRDNLLDRFGNKYEPWGVVRIGREAQGHEKELQRVDLDSRVKELMEMKGPDIIQGCRDIEDQVDSLEADCLKIREELLMLHAVHPMPPSNEVEVRVVGGKLEFHNHKMKKASWKPPVKPGPGQPQVTLLENPVVKRRLNDLIIVAESLWRAYAKKDRLQYLKAAQHNMQVNTKNEHWMRNNMPGLVAKERRLPEDLKDSFLATGHIVFATLNSCGRLLLSNTQKSFGAVIIDEAAQAMETSVLIPLNAADCKRCILVGDDRQLPPTVFTPQAEERGFSRPLFERLRLLGSTALMLSEQYRMAPQISAWPRKYFYGGQLLDGAGMERKRRRPLHKVCPQLLFIDLASSFATKLQSGSWTNEEEARACVAVVNKLFQASKELGEPLEKSKDIGVITFYTGQQAAIRQYLTQRKGQEQSIPSEAVRTVDAYQGGECEIIVLSTVRAPDVNKIRPTNVGFISDERRINVALTRAKSILVVIGHWQTLSTNKTWSDFIDHVWESDVRGMRRVHSTKSLDQELWPSLRLKEEPKQLTELAYDPEMDMAEGADGAAAANSEVIDLDDD
eukprot:TRINITY_DN26007_c0_g1_i1.p1 TRINITY_DN26007_c0_g1~~TRINITY_DN26007_c0_g1_i1.p1  ORF type:complete len:1401 (-),score=313.77 TRINITY_DN26007_c0_g1_i1:402-4604(-)